mmetsp:Transcript_5385/g.10230  ORF Transcript_5385/g.10230 Transcript_5385/m.10230 type:complete len:202 (-) Transcript_5385:790-1395(-)
MRSNCPPILSSSLRIASEHQLWDSPSLISLSSFDPKFRNGARLQFFATYCSHAPSSEGTILTFVWPEMPSPERNSICFGLPEPFKTTTSANKGTIHGAVANAFSSSSFTSSAGAKCVLVIVFFGPKPFFVLSVLLIMIKIRAVPPSPRTRLFEYPPNTRGDVKDRALPTTQRAVKGPAPSLCDVALAHLAEARLAARVPPF